MGDSLDIIDSKQSLLDSVTENSMDDYALNWHINECDEKKKVESGISDNFWVRRHVKLQGIQQTFHWWILAAGRTKYTNGILEMF